MCYNKRMKKEDLIKLLRNPMQYRKEKQEPSKETGAAAAAGLLAGMKPQDKVLLGVAAGVGVLVLLTILVMTSAKNRAENLTASLDPEQIKGLSVETTEFNPNTGVTYVQVREGQNRSVTVDELGTTLPIISRYNYKSFTPDNYKVIGAAPWALTTNFASNLNDPDLMRYLLSNNDMIQAFLAREDVAPLLEDPQLLLALTQDMATMRDFFDSDTVKAVLANQKMLRTVAGSRFMSYLLISKAAKYFRDRPQEAAAIIAANPYLKELQENPNVQIAVKENPYLKNISSVLLAPAAPAAPAAKNTRNSRRAKK